MNSAYAKHTRAASATAAVTLEARRQPARREPARIKLAEASIKSTTCRNVMGQPTHPRVSPGSSAEHTALVRAILADLGALPGIVIGINASGRASYVSEKTGERSWVPYGWPMAGGPDILVAVAPLGRLVALECKTGGATLTKEQREVHAALRAVGVEVYVVRSVEEARAALKGILSCRS